MTVTSALVSARNRPSFGRAGRPRNIKSSGLFLWEPPIELELRGLSASEFLGNIEPRLLVLYQDIRRKRNISIHRARLVLPDYLDSIGTPLADEYRKALSGEEYSVTSLGSGDAYIYSQSFKPNSAWPPQLPPLARPFIEIERDLTEPTLAWQRKDMARRAELLDSS